MVMTCAVLRCRATSKNDKDRRFFRFPANEQTCIKWIEAIGRPELLDKGVHRLRYTYSICDMHFDPSALDQLKKGLKSVEVPTLNLPSSENENPSKATQTWLQQSSIISDMLIETEQMQSEDKRRKVEDQHMALTKYLRDRNVSINLKKIITLKQNLKSLLESSDKEVIRFFALTIFLSFPQSYRILKDLLSLPSKTIFHKTSVSTKLNANILRCLETKIMNLEESERYCIVCADEITLKSSLYYQIDKDKIIGFHEIDGNQTAVPATQALVVMARGIFTNWQQPLGYCFTGQSRNHKELNKWFRALISKILTIGLKIVAFVPAKGSFFYDMAQGQLAKKISTETYFYVNKSQIYIIFDIPELVKSLIDNLMKYDFEFHDVDGTELKATWKDMETLYMLDSNRAYRLAPGLTKSHLDPSEAKNMKFEQYIEIFSKKVAAAMSCYKDLGDIGNECLGTIKLIELLHYTCDVLNSSLISDPSAAKSNQIETLNQFLDVISDVTVHEKNTNKDITNQISCLSDLRTSLMSIIDLSQSMYTMGFGALPTRRLNQNVLQQFLDSLRQQNKIPTPVKFSRAFQRLVMTNLLKHSKRCDDLDKLLFGKDDIDRLLKGYETMKTAVALTVETVDYRFDLPEQGGLTNLSGYLLNKCYEYHKCDKFRKYLLSAVNIEKEDEVMHLNPNVAIVSPPYTFIELIKKMDEIFVASSQYFTNNIGHEILKNMNEIVFDDCCPCFPISYLKKLFIRFRIFNVIRFNNKKIKVNDHNSKCFNVINL